MEKIKAARELINAMGVSTDLDDALKTAAVALIDSMIQTDKNEAVITIRAKAEAVKPEAKTVKPNPAAKKKEVNVRF